MARPACAVLRHQNLIWYQLAKETPKTRVDRISSTSLTVIAVQRAEAVSMFSISERVLYQRLVQAAARFGLPIRFLVGWQVRTSREGILV